MYIFQDTDKHPTELIMQLSVQRLSRDEIICQHLRILNSI